jgi:hypothetical protein
VEVIIKNNKKINLDKNSFVTSGGEAKIYVKNNICFKIYHEIKNIISLNKFKELSILDLPNIIKPEQLVFDIQKKPIGYNEIFAEYLSFM